MKMQNLTNLVPILFSFLRETKTEGKRINWPTREKTIKDTIIVIAFAVVVAVFLSTFDAIFQCFLSFIGIGFCALPFF